MRAKRKLNWACRMLRRAFTAVKTPRVAHAALMLAVLPCSIYCTPVAAAPAEARSTQDSESHGKFYCNIAALAPAERAKHHLLTVKLIAARKEIVETPKGYEFQFSPSDVTLAELAEWVAREAKCCPFFDFHIDLENNGNLLCLRLTGEEGIKAFIRSEFKVPAN